MTTRTNCRFFIDEETKEEVWITYAYLTKLKKYAKAGKYGKDLFCPLCNHEQRVHHFSWTSLTCLQCNKSVKKSEWFVRSNPSKFSKRLTLCNPKVKYFIDKTSIGERDERGTRLDGKYSPNSIWSHF